MTIDIKSAWEELKAQVETCTKCGLCETRNHTVFGEGPIENCRVVIIGEAPGEDEDNSGRPFIGKAGQLLTDILEKGGGILREEIYITNIVKCRPPNNRDPDKKEMIPCSEYLEAQLLLLRPSIVVTMGRISTQFLLNTSNGITSLRGEWKDWRGIKLLPMLHPSYLMRQEEHGDRKPKHQTWHDILSLRKKLDELKNFDMKNFDEES
ncbi:MAG: uracil-DNA glycosylase [Synergistaceae bacterium]|nr:uracil-DNA glycosylase [Synergistaceae bacterium]